MIIRVINESSDYNFLRASKLFSRPMSSLTPVTDDGIEINVYSSGNAYVIANVDTRGQLFTLEYWDDGSEDESHLTIASNLEGDRRERGIRDYSFVRDFDSYKEAESVARRILSDVMDLIDLDDLEFSVDEINSNLRRIVKKYKFHKD